MEEVILKKANNGWMLIWDDPEFTYPHIEVKEGSLNGLIDGFIETFMTDNNFDDKPNCEIMFSVKIEVKKIGGFETDAIKIKKRNLI